MVEHRILSSNSGSGSFGSISKNVEKYSFKVLSTGSTSDCLDHLLKLGNFYLMEPMVISLQKLLCAESVISGNIGIKHDFLCIKICWTQGNK